LKKVVLAGIALFVVAAVAIAIFDPDSLSGPDAGQQEKALTKCLEESDFTVKSEIPPAGRGAQNPEYEVEVSRGGGVVAYVYLFDFPEEAQSFVDDAKLDAETEDEKPTIERRGRAAVDLDSGASSTPEVRACIDEAGKPPPDEN
jgi:hypothetical protein